MKGIIIYKSNYGVTKQYAEWLKEETGYPAIEIERVKRKDILDADIVIIGGPVLAHTISVAKWVKKKWNILKDKKVILFSTSGTSPQSHVLRNIFESSFETGILNKIKYFPQGGRMIFNELTAFDKLVMRLGQKMEKNPQIREEMVRDKDIIDRNGLQPILQYVM
ncbi:MAG: hypothetical protein JW864_05300 [Spirochaetes bacterium]|nr:hypothetical protein [Spirochaetota bacterium]